MYWSISSPSSGAFLLEREKHKMMITQIKVKIAYYRLLAYCTVWPINSVQRKLTHFVIGRQFRYAQPLAALGVGRTDDFVCTTVA